MPKKNTNRPEKGFAGGVNETNLKPIAGALFTNEFVNANMMIMGAWEWILIALGAWVIVAWTASWLLRNPRGEVLYGILRIFAWVYAKLVHRVQFLGTENIPERRIDADTGQRAGPGLVVIANHTAGVDPILIQLAMREYDVRWVMTSEMRVRVLDIFWDWLRIIFVSAGGSELGAVKEMIRHVKSGGSLGIFPEGRIARPPGTLCPFAPGIGMVIAKSNAPILPVLITGTPAAKTAWASLFVPSLARVKFLPVIDPAGRKGDALVAELQSLFERELGVKAALQADAVEPSALAVAA